ncbi:hypothetical protein AAG570_000619 [Ranatra chinensis]|uniref:Uncharacterized protein n=1 Tax=Ranatra chinensis TaxID=642074 RepID=A0ABD0YZL8_9HEMI
MSSYEDVGEGNRRVIFEEDPYRADSCGAGAKGRMRSAAYTLSPMAGGGPAQGGILQSAFNPTAVELLYKTVTESSVCCGRYMRTVLAGVSVPFPHQARACPTSPGSPLLPTFLSSLQPPGPSLYI